MTRNRGRGEDAKIQTEQGNSRRVRREALMRAYPYILLILTPPLSPRAAIWRSWVEIERGQLQALERVELVAKSSRATRAASGPWSPSRLVVETKERRRRGNGEHNEHKRLCSTFHFVGVLLIKMHFRKLIFERICISV